MSTIAERVARGVAWLDETRPGWAERVDLDRLDLASPCRCVLGQEFGDYFEIVWSDGAPPDTQAYGFNAASPASGRQAQSREFDALEAEWRRVIAERRATS